MRPIERAIALFTMNLEALDFRQHLYDLEAELFEGAGWGFWIISALYGLPWQRSHRKAGLQLKVRRRQYERAIQELRAGKREYAILQLRALAEEALHMWRRPGFWQAFRIRSLVYPLPPPMAPGVPYKPGAMWHVQTYTHIVQLIQDLSDEQSL
jgi:hypothetical protein